jgi:LPS O-antigen subunit length determinant protein (WzzB/FepE family)
MSENRRLPDDEIDFFEVFKALWNAKYKIFIITAVTAILGLSFSLTKPNYFYVETDIRKGNNSVFFKYKTINDLLENTNLNSELTINPEVVFTMFVNEFRDYEEMVNVLSKNEFVIQSIQQLDDDSKHKRLIEYAQLFDIEFSATSKSRLTFKWHDVEEGKVLFTRAITETLENVKKTIINDVKVLALSRDMAIKHELENLEVQLKQAEKISSYKLTKRKRFLLEQSSIAKELSIKGNTLDFNTLSGSESGLTLSLNAESVPYYLRGYMAIDNELALINSRSVEEQRIMVDSVMDLIHEIETRKSDIAPQQLRNSLDDIKEVNPNSWVIFNFALATSESTFNRLKLFVLSAFLGLILGVIYILILNATRHHR